MRNQVPSDHQIAALVELNTFDASPHLWERERLLRTISRLDEKLHRGRTPSVFQNLKALSNKSIESEPVSPGTADDEQDEAA
jgi:hypothetical protein